MTAPTASLCVRKMLPCSPAEAFQAWTDPVQFQEWFEPQPGMKTQAQFDVRVGGKYLITFFPASGKPPVRVVGEFLVVDRPRRLEYTWIWENNPDWKDRTIVKLEFNAAGPDRTEIVLTHENFSDPEDRDAHNEGWSRILDCMAAAKAKK